MKVFDCFTFFNELDLLEFRLKFLDKYVDYFVLAESNFTFSGKSKPYYYKAAEERFSKWHHKIVYLQIQQSIEGLTFEKQDHYNPQSAAFQMEYEQRNALLKADPLMSENDLVLLSDLDEIPLPASIKKAKQLDKPLAFSHLFHYYFLNCQNTGNSRWWKGCIASSAKQFKEITPQGLRDKRDSYPSLPHAGWHFSFLGGVEKIRQKLLSFAHTEFNKEEFTNEEHIKEAILKGEDILKREGVSFRYVPLSYYPATLQRIMKEYPELLYPKKKNFLADCYFTARRIVKGTF